MFFAEMIKERIKLIFFSILLCSNLLACKNNTLNEIGEYNQNTEIRILDSGKINLTQSLTFELTKPNSMRGVGISLPLKYQTINKDLPLEYRVLFTMHNNKKAPFVIQEKNPFVVIYVGDLSQLLPAGRHTFSVQVEIAGFDYSQKGFDEFVWSPVDNFNAALKSASITLFPPPKFHPNVGKYFGALWLDPAQEKAQPIQAQVKSDHIRYALQDLPANSRFQLIARWPITVSKPVESGPCDEFGEGFTWNSSTGKCQRA